jgi:hypothetical protein
MNNPKVPEIDHRKLIPIWIEAEKTRLEPEEPPLPKALDGETLAEIEKIFEASKKDARKPETKTKLTKQTGALVTKRMKKIIADRKKVKLPSQYEREQKIMELQRMMPPSMQLISPNMLDNREDVFKARIRGKGEVKGGFNNQEGNPDVNRVENWSIWAWAWAMNGSDTCVGSYYWRYRIWVGNFDTDIQPDRRLVVTPWAVLSGYYYLVAYEFMNQYPFFARAKLRCWTGTWHWHYSRGTYNPEWSGWRRSRDVFRREISKGYIYDNINVPYPGTKVSTPARWDPPGVITQPNPINCYGAVAPYDVVDFYVLPEICVETQGLLTYSRLDFSLIDVPFVTAEFETGYYL